ncbi:MAG: hypothetical protein M3N93_02660 [Acidobacteriota bacterium]|nr:hypothetical protein [Acidobacteriota bacterium]
MVLEAEEARAQVQRIFQSKTFRSSDVLRQLLSYLVDISLAGAADELKEYTVAVDALGKPSSYDPRQESAVRMQVGRIRQKLAEYYRTEGAEDPVIVDLPKGGFRVVFEPRKAPFGPLAAEEPIVDEMAEPRWRRREIILLIALAFALASTALFAWRSFYPPTSPSRSGEAVVPWTPDIQQLWQPILSSNRPLVVCIATPLAVLIPGFGFLREFSVNDWEDVPKSKAIAALKDALHATTVQPTFGYTGVGTAGAALLLGQFLGARQKSLVVTRANLLSLPELMEENVVFLGPLTGDREIRALRVDQEILLEPDGIRNLHPRPGEPAFVPEAQGRPNASFSKKGGEDSLDTYSLISRVPGLRGKGEILSLSGNQISSVMAGAQALTDPSVAKMLVAKMRKPDGSIPRYFQVVLRVRSMDGVPTEITYMFHRELTVNRPPAPPEK